MIPEFLKELLIKQYGEKLTQEILNGYQTKRFETIRVNTLKSTKEEVKKVERKNNVRYASAKKKKAGGDNEKRVN